MVMPVSDLPEALLVPGPPDHTQAPTLDLCCRPLTHACLPGPQCWAGKAHRQWLTGVTPRSPSWEIQRHVPHHVPGDPGGILPELGLGGH